MHLYARMGRGEYMVHMPYSIRMVMYAISMVMHAHVCVMHHTCMCDEYGYTSHMPYSVRMVMYAISMVMHHVYARTDRGV